MTAPANVAEEWRPVPDHPGYEASNTGRVRSVRRGRPIVLRPTNGPCGFPTTRIMVDGRGCCRRVPNMVALAWIGPRPAGAQIRHLDGDPTNSAVVNLRYGTRAEVKADHAARARREEAAGAATHCDACGGRFADSWLSNWGARYCPTCATRYHVALQRANRVPAPLRTGQCVDCGAPLTARIGPMARRCEQCAAPVRAGVYRRYRAKMRPEQWQEQNRRYRERHGDKERARHRAAYVPVQPRVASCADCGESLPPKIGPGPVALRCPSCKAKARAEATRRCRARRAELVAA